MISLNSVCLWARLVSFSSVLTDTVCTPHSDSYKNRRVSVLSPVTKDLHPDVVTNTKDLSVTRGTISPSITMSWDPWSSPCSHMHRFCFCSMPLNQCNELGPETVAFMSQPLALEMTSLLWSHHVTHQWPSFQDTILKFCLLLTSVLLIYTTHPAFYFWITSMLSASGQQLLLFFLAGETTQGLFVLNLPHLQKNRPPLIGSMWSISPLSRIPKKPWASADWPVSKQPCLWRLLRWEDAPLVSESVNITSPAPGSGQIASLFFLLKKDPNPLL